MQSVYNQATTTNGVVTGHCTGLPVTITGNITVRLNESGAGEIEMEWTENTGAAGQCPGHAPSFRASGMVSSAANITLASEFPADTIAGGNRSSTAFGDVLRITRRQRRQRESDDVAG